MKYLYSKKSDDNPKFIILSYVDVEVSGVKDNMLGFISTATLSSQSLVRLKDRNTCTDISLS